MIAAGDALPAALRFAAAAAALCTIRSGAVPSIPRRAEVVALWEEATGRQAGDTRWFVALAVWKLAILLEASYHRWLAGLSDDAFFARLDEGVPALLARAREVCGA